MNDCTDTTSALDTLPSSYDCSSEATTSMVVDLDGDGWGETIVSDTNGDGVADVYDWLDPYSGTQVIAIDGDADGVIDTAAVDVDGDGELDLAVADTDGDGELETSFDPATGETTLPFDPAQDPDVDPSSTVDPVTIDPTAVVDEHVHGDPMAEIPYHQAQVGDNDCLPTSVAMVATEVLGLDVPQGDLVDLANELELLGPDGMALEGGVTLLEHYGLEAEVQEGSMDDLRTLLDAGTPVIIGLDADDLYGTGDTPFADDFVMGHAVVITGIDDEAGLVYINDPGFPDGAGIAVPIEDFEDAWVDGGNSMVVVDADSDSSVQADPTVDPPNVTGAHEHGLGLIDLVLLPLRLVVN